MLPPHSLRNELRKRLIRLNRDDCIGPLVYGALVGALYTLQEAVHPSHHQLALGDWQEGDERVMASAAICKSLLASDLELDDAEWR